MATPSQLLHITLVQSTLHWEQVDSNLAAFSELLSPIKPGETDLIILPEMFTSGFTMQAHKVAQSMNGSALQWMAEQASNKQAVLVGSLVIEEEGKFYNRLIWMRPDGSYRFYNKRHLFRMGKEDQTYQAGQEKIIETIHGWRICPLICYDLRFPVWSRNQNDYDVLLYIANWPDVRNYPWQQLLIARAIENQCYVVGLNRVGEDGHGTAHSGHSTALDPKGYPLLQLPPNQTCIDSTALSYNSLMSFRETFPAFIDADRFQINT